MRSRLSLAAIRRVPPFALAGLAAALVVHVWLAASIISQPLGVNTLPDERSVLWPFSQSFVHMSGPGADLYSVVEAGSRLRAGENPYNFFVNSGRLPYLYPFRYLPGAAYIVSLPLSYIAPRPLFVGWALLLEATLFVFVILILRAAPGRWWGPALAILLLLSFPFFVELHMGQFSFLAMALAGMALLVRSKLLRAGLIVFGALLKIFPVLAAVPLLLTGKAGDGRTVVARSGWTLPAGLALLCLSQLALFLVFGDWWRLFYAINYQKWSGLVGGNFSPLYGIYLLSGDLGYVWTNAAWRKLQSAASLLAFLPVLWLVWRRRGAELLVSGAALLLAFLVCLVATWEHTYSAVVACGVLLCLGLARRRELALSSGARVVGSGSCWSDGSSLAMLGFGLCVWAALPTPYFLLSGGSEGMQVDPVSAWPRSAAYLYVFWKVLPLLGLYGTALVALFYSPPELPQSEERISPKNDRSIGAGS